MGCKIPENLNRAFSLVWEHCRTFPKVYEQFRYLFEWKTLILCSTSNSKNFVIINWHFILVLVSICLLSSRTPAFIWIIV